jgi:hypothetical protein
MAFYAPRNLNKEELINNNSVDDYNKKCKLLEIKLQ